MKRVMTVVIVSIIFLISFNGFAQIDSTFVIETMPIQKDIMSKLTGKTPIKGSIFLSQRATIIERELTVDYLSKYLYDLGWESDNHHYKATNGNPFLDLFLAPVSGINVVAVLPATTSSTEYVIFGSHYDTERNSPGAIDNATGVTLSITVAGQLVKLKERNVNFIIILFDQEEDDEVGSREYVKLLKRKKLDIHSVHIMDMMGWDSNNNRAVTFQSPSTFLDTIYIDWANKLNIPFQVIDGGSSDNRQFIIAGYKTIATFEELDDSTPFIHKPTDTYDTVNFNYLMSGTHLIYQVLKSIAE